MRHIYVGILSLCSLKRLNEKWRENKIFEFPLAKGHCPISEEEKVFDEYIYNCSSSSS